MQSKFIGGRTATKRDRSGKALERGRGRRRALLCSLRMEQLERREMLAGDVMHNQLIPQDVNSDFRVTPLDVLSVINYLNNRGRSTGEGESAASGGVSKPQWLDVNNDQRVTPIDLLNVINTINAGEGEPFLAQVNVVPIDANGVPLPSQVVDGVTEYIVGLGQSFFLRTQVRDIRQDPQGVAQVYLDVDVNDADATPGLNVDADFNEIQVLDLQNVNGGSFTLNYGGTETSSITVATNASGQINTSTTAQTILAALNPIFGSGNVAVRGFGGGNNAQFEIRFIGSQANTDVPNPTVGQNQLTAPSGSPVIAITIENDASVLYPSEPNRILDENNTLLPLRYSRFTQGGLLRPAPDFIQINEVGGFFDSPIFEAFEILDPGRYSDIFDVAFEAIATGISTVTTNVADGNSSILLVGGAEQELPADSIQFSAPIRINVVARVQAINDAYPRTGEPAIVEDGGAVTLNDLTANDIVREGNLIGIQSVTQPAGNVGTVTFTQGGDDVTFTPAANFFGTATFTYTIANDQGDQSTGTVSVTVDPVNDPPIPVSPLPSFSIAEDSQTPLTVTAAEVFTAGPNETGAVRFSPATQLAPGSTGGTVSVDAAGNLVFTPATNFFGTVLVDAVAIDDGGAASAPVRLTITVTPINDSPIPLGPTFSTAEDTTLMLAPAQLFAAGPTNESGQAITLSGAVLAPNETGGTVAIDASGNLVFTPDENFFGDVAIRVTGTDNGSPELATEGSFTITVTPVNDPPTAVDDDFVVQGVLGIEQELLVLDNDSAGPANEPASDLRITRVFNQSGPGTLRIAEDRQSVLYTPPEGTPTGDASFSYEITDSVAGTLTSTANVTIVIVPPVLPFAVRDTRTVAEGSGTVTVDVLANDLANEGETKVLVDFTQPSSGTVTRDPGTLPDSSDDRLVFTPSSIDFFGTVTFEYTLDDTGGADSEPSTGTVTINVTEVNDAPTLVNPPAQQTSEDVVDFRIPSTTLLAGSSPGPLEGGQELTVTSARVLSGGGSVEVRGGELFFTAATDSVQDVVVEYTATDDGLTNGQPDPRSTTATVLIRLSPVNDAPIAAPDAASTAEDQSVLIPASTILANDRAARASAGDELNGSQSLQITGVRVLSGGGSATLENGSVRYNPAGNFNGGVVLEYTITDVDNAGTPGFVALTATSTINVTVTEVNDPPANFMATRSVFAGLPTRLNFAAELAGTSRGAPNEATQNLVIRSIVSVPAFGTATVNPEDGTITYFAPLGSSGSVTLVVETVDNGTTAGQADPRTARGTITINVAPFQPSTVAGVVYADDDANNVVDAVDLRLGGVEVRLVGTTVAEGGGAISRTAITDADGSYSFDILPPGTYTVSYVRPVMAIDGPSPDSVTQTIVIPGGQTIVANFSILGVDAPLVSVIDNLSEGYYGQYPHVRGKGIDAVIQADGQMAFSVVRGGYDVDFCEVSMSADGRSVFLTVVNNGVVSVAGVPRGKYFVARDSAGNTLIRIVALPHELSFTSIGAAPTSARTSPGFMSSVDAYFADLGRA